MLHEHFDSRTLGEAIVNSIYAADKINDDLVEQLPPSAIKHFFEKLLKLESLMHTDTAKMIATRTSRLYDDVLETVYGMELSRLDIEVVV